MLASSALFWLVFFVRLFLVIITGASCFYIGFFLWFGAEFISVVDKYSLFEAIFYYAMFFSFFVAVLTLITGSASMSYEAELDMQAMPDSSEATQKNRWLFDELYKRVDAVEREMTLLRVTAKSQIDQVVKAIRTGAKSRFIVFALACLPVLMVFLGIRNGLCALILFLIVFAFYAWVSHVRAAAAAAVVLFIIGLARAEYLLSLSPDVRLHLSDEVVEGIVILSAHNGALYASPKTKRMFFVPWHNIKSIEGIKIFNAQSARQWFCSEWSRMRLMHAMECPLAISQASEHKINRSS